VYVQRPRKPRFGSIRPPLQGIGRRTLFARHWSWSWSFVALMSEQIDLARSTSRNGMDNRYQFCFPTASPLCIDPNLTEEEKKEKTKENGPPTSSYQSCKTLSAPRPSEKLNRNYLPPSGRTKESRRTRLRGSAEKERRMDGLV
jgi:hypothetical protein